MKINAKGAVTFSVRNNDKDLYAFFEELPDGTGSDIIRALIRDGLAYQRFFEEGAVSSSNLHMLCTLRRINLDSVLTAYHNEIPNVPLKEAMNTNKVAKNETNEPPVAEDEQQEEQQEEQQDEQQEEQQENTEADQESNTDNKENGNNEELDDMLMSNASFV